MVLRLALREIRRSPGTALPIVLTIALATGFVSAAVSVVDGVLLRPLPYADVGSLVVLDHAVPYGEVAEWRAGLRSVQGIAGATSADHAVRGLGRARILRTAFVTSGFFATVRPTVLAGRLPEPGDGGSVVVSERVLHEGGIRPGAALGSTLTVLDGTFTVTGVLPADVGIPLFRDRKAVGLLLPYPIPGTGGRRATVVGVVEDVRYAGLVAPLQGAVYVPWDALPFGMVRLVVRTGGHPRSVAAPIAALGRRLDPSRPIEDIRPLHDVVAGSVAGQRTYAVVASALAITALAVALVGLLAALSRVVAARRHEFAVRSAIGATAPRLAGLVFREAALVIAAGVFAGIPLAWAAGNGVASFLYGVSATEAGTYVIVAGATSVAALLSCAWPAWRALSTSPVELLRIDAARG